MPADDDNKEDEVNTSDEDTEKDVADSSGQDDQANDANDSSSSKDEDSDNEQNEAPAPFSMLDLKSERCFGWQPKANICCWYNLSLTGKANGWTEPLTQRVEKSLKQNVDDCYFCLAQLNFIDLDDDVKYHAQFDSAKGMWKLSIADSPDAELTLEQIGNFFKSDIMKRCAKRCYDLVIRAYREFEQTLRPMLEDGKLLDVDEVKLAAILHFISEDITMQNLRTCKWMS